jgi:hypothetical protein
MLQFKSKLNWPPAMHITANLVAGIAIYGVLAISAAYAIALIWLGEQMRAIAQSRPDLAFDVPDYNLATSRTAAMVTSWWAWTDRHRKIGDRTLSRVVMISRILCVATLAAWLTLFIAPRDFAERAEAAFNGHAYIAAP